MHFETAKFNDRQFFSLYAICNKMSIMLYRKYSTVVDKYNMVALISLQKTSQLLFFPVHINTDSYHFIHGFTKLPAILNGYC